MLDYSNIINDSNAFQMIKSEFECGKSAHTYLFLGEDEEFLTQFIEEVACMFVSTVSKDDFDKNLRRIKKRVHPDVKFFGEKKSVDKSMADEIIGSILYLPYESDKKIYVIFVEDDPNLSISSKTFQNKILKTLEEPNESSYFFLASSSKEKLLSTVISRSKQIVLDSLCPEQISKLLENSGISSDKAQIIATCSNGDGAFAEKLAEDKEFFQFFDSVVSCFLNVNASHDILEYVSIFSAKSVNKKEFTQICLLILRDVQLILSKQNELVSLKNIENKLEIISSKLNFASVQRLITVCEQVKNDLSMNVNGVAAVDKILLSLAEEKVKCRRLSV